MSVTKRPLFDAPIVRRAARESFTKLAPRKMVRNPVMFVVLVGSILTTLVLARDIATGQGEIGFTLQLAIWLWFTVLFANFAEAMAEGRGKAQADSLRATRTQTMAKQLKNPSNKTAIVAASSANLRVGDYVICMPGDVIPGDGEVTEGVASVDESAITGESAPVIRESGGDRSAVTGGTKVLSDFLVIRITANPGETFLDRMIALIEGDHAIEERFAGVCRDANDQEVGEHLGAARDRRAVAARLTNDRRGLARDGRLVDGCDAFGHLSVARDHVARHADHVIPDAKVRRGRGDDRGLIGRVLQLLGHRLRTRGAQAVGLRLAAPLRHCLGEIREEHREPEPDCELQREADLALPGRDVASEHERGQDAADQHDEHDRVPHHLAGRELGERLARGAPDDGCVEERTFGD